MRVLAIGFRRDSIPLPGVALLLTTPGDLVVRNTTANVRLPVGANGTVLMANSARQEGVEWASRRARNYRH